MGVNGDGGRLRHAGLGLLAAAGPLLLLAHLGDHPVARIVLVLLVLLVPVALIAIGLKTPAPGAGAFLGALSVLLVGSGLGLLALPATGPLVLGLPAAAALMLLGLWCLPLVLAVWVYAATFPRWTLDPDDLERLRRRASTGDGEGGRHDAAG